MASGITFKLQGSNNLLNNISKANKDLEKPLQRLASGKRLNSASDDPAGLAIANQLAANVQINSQALRNVEDSRSAIQIADGATQELGNISTRLAELAAQSANGTLSDSQRQSLQTEFSALTDEANRIVATTQFNGQNLLGGQGGFSSQVGSDSSSDSQLQVNSSQVQGVTNALSQLSIGTQQQAASALDSINSAIQGLSQQRGSFGAVESRLDSAQNSISSKKEAEATAQSRIEDADVADELARKVAANIRLNAGVALAAQNPNAQVIKTLLS